MQTRIAVDNLSFHYLPGKPVFERLNLHVTTGEVLCLLGPNGTGKSTLIKCLGGLLHPQSGSVLLDAKPLSVLSPSAIARLVGYVPQGQPSIFPFLVRDVVVMGRAAHLNAVSSPSRADYAIARDAMALVGIEHISTSPCNAISSGEWQLVLIARALTQNPKILLLDEPTSHLDLGKQMRILKVIMDLASTGLTIVMATHFPDHALLAAQRVVILKNKRLIAMGTPIEVVTSANLQDAYGIAVKILRVDGEVGRTICVPMVGHDFVKEGLGEPLL
ncbi:MAG: ABC transporter ATP-binding protein [Syntrophaceae bacterium]